jgi:hypothetical protein
MRVLAMILCTFLMSACGEWPDVPYSTASQANAAWPTLVAIEDALPVAGSALSPEQGAEALALRAADLRRRAALLRSPVADQEAFERLRARLDG